MYALVHYYKNLPHTYCKLKQNVEFTLQPRYFLLVDAKNLQLQPSLALLHMALNLRLSFFYNLISMIIQDNMMGNCRFALIHI